MEYYETVDFFKYDFLLVTNQTKDPHCVKQTGRQSLTFLSVFQKAVPEKLQIAELICNLFEIKLYF